MTTLTTLRKSEIPEYLKHGELYRTLMENNDDPNEEVTFPANVLKWDTTVQCVADCDHLLSSVRFWALDRFVSKELITFALFTCTDTQRLHAVFHEYTTHISVAFWLIKTLKQAPDYKLRIAIKSGMIELVQPLVESGCILPIDSCDLSAEAGNTDLFVYLYAHGCGFNAVTAKIAARRGHTAILRVMQVNGYNIRYDELFQAVQCGHVECVKSDCFQHVLPGRLNSKLCDVASRLGKLPMLQYLHEVGCDWDQNTTATAARNGQLDCLQYLHEHNCPWDIKRICREPASRGRLQCLQYTHTHGCSVDSGTFRSAMNGDHLNCLQYVHMHGCIWTIAIEHEAPSTCIVNYYDQGRKYKKNIHRRHACYAYLLQHATNANP